MSSHETKDEKTDEPETEKLETISDDELDDVAAGGPFNLDGTNPGHGF